MVRIMKLEFPATVIEGYRITIPANHRKQVGLKVGTDVKVTIEVTDRFHRSIIE